MAASHHHQHSRITITDAAMLMKVGFFRYVTSFAANPIWCGISVPATLGPTGEAHRVKIPFGISWLSDQIVVTGIC